MRKRKVQNLLKMHGFIIVFVCFKAEFLTYKFQGPDVVTDSAIKNMLSQIK